MPKKTTKAKKTVRKATKKVAAKKSVSRETEPKKLDLSKPLSNLGDSKENRELVNAHLEQLKVSVGWKILEQVMGDNLQVLAQQIVDKVDLNGQPLTDEQVDELRIQHNQIKQLKGMPDILIATFTPQEGKPDPQYDPYSGEGIPTNVLSMSDTT